MKKMISLSAFFVVMLNGVALLVAQPRFGVKAGLNMTNLQYSGREDPFEATAIFQKASDPRFFGFVGGLAELDLKKNFTLSGEIQVSSIGYHLKNSGQSLDFTEYHARLWYVHIPVSINTRWNGFFAGAGPYLGVGIAGTQEQILTDSLKNVVFRNKTATAFGSSSDKHYQRIDFGVQAQAGYSFRNVRLIVSYNLGLTDVINKFYSPDGNARWRILAVSAAYILGVGE